MPTQPSSDDGGEGDVKLAGETAMGKPVAALMSGSWDGLDTGIPEAGLIVAGAKTVAGGGGGTNGEVTANGVESRDGFG